MTRWTLHGRAVPVAVLFALWPMRLAGQTPGGPDPLAVRAAFIPRTNDRTFRGLAAAWRDADSLRFAVTGTTGADGGPLSPDVRVPLGEAGAILTEALLANMVVRGEVSLDDPAQRLMPAGVRLPTRGGRAITLGDLALHRAGLPATAAGTGVTPSRLAKAVNGTALRSAIGARYAFSQLGIDLLGAALANHLALPLPRAISERILHPLGLDDMTFVAAESASTVVGWHASLTRLAQLAVAASDTVRGPLASTFALMLRTRSLGADSSLPVALGWRVLRLDDRDIYWHDALDVPGFSAYVAFDPARQAVSAVVGVGGPPVAAIAGQILLGRVPVIAAAPARRAAAAARPSARPRPRPRRR